MKSRLMFLGLVLVSRFAEVPNVWAHDNVIVNNAYGLSQYCTFPNGEEYETNKMMLEEAPGIDHHNRKVAELEGRIREHYNVQFSRGVPLDFHSMSSYKGSMTPLDSEYLRMLGNFERLAKERGLKPRFNAVPNSLADYESQDAPVDVVAFRSDYKFHNLIRIQNLFEHGNRVYASPKGVEDLVQMLKTSPLYPAKGSPEAQNRKRRRAAVEAAVRDYAVKTVSRLTPQEFTNEWGGVKRLVRERKVNALEFLRCGHFTDQLAADPTFVHLHVYQGSELQLLKGLIEVNEERDLENIGWFLSLHDGGTWGPFWRGMSKVIPLAGSPSLSDYFISFPNVLNNGPVEEIIRQFMK